jgi:hypothetical protein
LTFQPRPSPAVQGRDKGALKVNLEQAPAFKPEKAQGLTSLSSLNTLLLKQK